MIIVFSVFSVFSSVFAKTIELGNASDIFQFNGIDFNAVQTANNHWYLNSYEGVQIRVDSDASTNPEINNTFQINNGANDVVMSVDETGEFEVRDSITGQNGKYITHLPWYDYNQPVVQGYLKLITPIYYKEGNMFAIKIKGYEYNHGYYAVDIRCVGYAYSDPSLGGLINTNCNTIGTDLPVEIGVENNYVVIRLGTPTWNDWYFSHFTAEYIGEKAHDPDDFIWVKGETTPVQTGNTNKVFANDASGTLQTTAGIAAGGYSPDPTQLITAPTLFSARGEFTSLCIEGTDCINSWNDIPGEGINQNLLSVLNQGSNADAFTGATIIGGDVRIGAVTDDDGSTAGWGRILHFSGGDDWPGWDSDNSDALYMGRYNTGNNQSDLRIVIGDDSQAEDRLVVGNAANNERFIFQSNGYMFVPTGAVQAKWIHSTAAGNNTIAGNLGIGTTAPGSKLVVKQSAGGADPGNSVASILLGNDATFGALLHVKNVGNRGNIGNSDGSPLFRADFTDATAMIIDKSGNVGIRTESPTATLDVRRGTATNGTAYFMGSTYGSHFNYSSGENTYIRGGKSGSKVYINDAHNGDVIIANGGGRVGIGVSPDAKLHVRTSGGGEAVRIDGGSGYPRLYFDSGDSTVLAVINRQTGDAAKHLYFGETADTGKYIFRSSGETTFEGRVGIGMTNPSAKLQVNPPADTEGIKIVSSNYSPFVIQDADGEDLARINQDGDLTVAGGVRLGNTTIGSKTCDAGALGMMIFDTDEDKPYVCTSSSSTWIWKPLDSDYDKDGITDWQDDDDNDDSILDNELIAGNVKSGIDIFGITGTYTRSGGFAETYSYKGSAESYTITAGMVGEPIEIYVKAAGGAGGDSGIGAAGGGISATFIPAQTGTLTIDIGQGGVYGTGQVSSYGGDGRLGGQSSSADKYASGTTYGGGGGGASVVKFNGTLLLIAGGGGGGAGWGPNEGGGPVDGGAGGSTGCGSSGGGKYGCNGVGGLGDWSNTPAGDGGTKVGGIGESFGIDAPPGGGGGGGYGGGGGGHDTGNYYNGSGGGGGGGYVNTSLLSSYQTDSGSPGGAKYNNGTDGKAAIIRW